jgi:hypothetical protein
MHAVVGDPLSLFRIHQHGLDGDLQPNESCALVFKSHHARGGWLRRQHVVDSSVLEQEPAWQARVWLDVKPLTKLALRFTL